MTRNSCQHLLIPIAAILIFIRVVSAQPSYYTDKIDSIPDLTQTDFEANFPAGGKEFCLHSAVTNSLMWLDSHGFPNLVDNTGDPLADQVKLAKLLASKTYMDTDPEEGTGTTNLIRGLKKYIADRGYQIESLQYQGWRPVAEDVTRLTTSQIPLFDQIKQGVLGNGAVWLNVGWYKYDASKDEYKRISGHWVTLVGYGKDQNDNPNPNILILHDPSPRAGTAFDNEYVLAIRITTGVLAGEFKGLPRTAAGLYKLTNGMHIKPQADCAIIDGAVSLKLKSQISQDRPTTQKQSSKSDNITEFIGTGYVTTDEPTDLPALKKNLSKAEFLENFDILCQAIDRYYSFFEHKRIDWNKIIDRYRLRVLQVKTADEFYTLMYQLVRELKDCHSWLCNYPRAALQSYSPEITIRKIKDTAVAADVSVDSQAYAKGIRKGSIIVEVDGLSIKDKLEQIRPLMKIYSSERAFFEDAYRRLLDGPKGTNVSLRYLPNGKNTLRAVTLTRVDYRPKDLLDPKVPLEKRRFIWFGHHSSGYGYIRILSFQGRDEIADEFDSALEELKDTPGLIIDIRENPGGFGTSQKRIIGRLITAETRVNISYEKNGPDHNDFKIRETCFSPAGPWQYTKPIVLLINTITGSASDLFACRIISTGRVVTIGTPTHGNSSGECVYAVLLCGLVVRISTGYICDTKGRIIETNGNEPDIYVEQSIKDITTGRDTVFERAVQELDRLCRQ
jgi:C-terminal processing protease CtpA/Prc